jgi:CxxC-x17-CxxC domain-containing protein
MATEGGEATVTFADKVLTCRECGREFVFTIGEQEFYQSRGLMHEPRRCPDCRNQRRQSEGSHRAVREMFDVTCSSCGRPTQVPFRPTGARPVYCQDCYQAVRTR